MASDLYVECFGLKENIEDGETNDDNKRLTSYNPPRPTKTKKFTSPVWNDFAYLSKKVVKLISGIEKEVEVTYAKCKMCRKEIPHTGSMGTTHLLNHTKKCPRRAAVGICQQIIQASNKRDETCTISNYRFNDKRSQYLLAQAIIVHELPFNFVTYKKFREYAHSLCPEHTIPSCTTIAELCKNVYDVEKSKLYEFFSHLDSKVSVTMDKWATSPPKKSYMCITAHFIDKDWSLQKRIIKFFNINGATAVDICNALSSCLLDWNLDKKLLSVVVNNDSASGAALKLAQTRAGNNLFCNGMFFHVRCVAHVINLIVQDGVKVIEKVVEKVRNSVKFFTCSPKMTTIFLEIVKQSQIKSSKSLCLDVATRWNSTYFMLCAALEYKDAFKRYAIKDNQYTNCPDDNEWEHVEILCNCLKHFFDVTKLFSSSRYVTASLLFEELCEIRLILLEWSRSLDKSIVAISAAMKEKFEKYWDMCDKIFIVATFLDPRYKVKILELYYQEIYGQYQYRIHLDVAMNVIKKLFEEYNKSHSKETQNTTHTYHAIDIMASDPLKKKSRFDAYMESRVSQQVKSELDIYIEEEVYRWSGDKEKFDLLIWWQQHCGKYPILSKMARDIFAIPISTIAFESTFNTRGRIIDPCRSKLTPTMVEALLCAQDWIKAECEVVQEVDGTFEEDASSSIIGAMTCEVTRDDGCDFSDYGEMQDEFW